MSREVTRPKQIVDGRDGARIRTRVAIGSAERLLREFRQWAPLRAQHNRLGTRIEQLKTDMKTYIETNGVPDSSGHRVLTFDEPVEIDGTTYAGLRNEARRTTLLDEEAAREILTQKGLLDHVVKTQEYLDQDEIYVLYQQDLLTDTELEKIFTTRISWAFKPDPI